MVHPSVESVYGPLSLRCESLDNPLGIDVNRPRLSWLVNDPTPRRGAVQSAYQILAASSLQNLEWDKADLWDSGKVAGDRSILIPYAGQSLTSRQRVWWKVRTWNGGGEASRWSAVAWFETGLLQRDEWKAEWMLGPVRPDDAKGGTLPCPLMRKTFSCAARVRRARLYATARGLYIAHLNGKRIGDDLFTPGWTDYTKRIQYQTYDVTELLKDGPNVIGLTLGDGWYCGKVAWKDQCYGKEPSALAQLVIEYDDDRTEIIVTDGTWKVGSGAIRASDFLDGEIYDARMTAKGWNEPGFDDSSWMPVRTEPLTPRNAPVLQWSASQRVRRLERITPIAQTQPQPGVHVFDLGQNFAGYVRLSLPATTPAGLVVKLRHAEVLNPDGTMYVTNLRQARATDIYTAKGGAATWEPSFTFHGFRYVEVTLSDADPAAASSNLRGGGLWPDASWITGVVVQSDTPVTGHFECSHALINQLQHNIQWGQKSNFLEVPTDCPQRNERLGWTGDAQVFVRTAAFNMDVHGFFRKWLVDLDDAMRPEGDYPPVAPDIISHAGGPGWSDAGIICPWTIYLAYGDRELLEEHYAPMMRYIDFLDQHDPDKRHNYGDWLNHGAFTPLDVIDCLFHANSVAIMHQIATVLGKKADRTKLATHLKRVKALFNRKFVTPEGRIVGDTQTAYLLALRFNMLPAKLRPAALERLRQDIQDGRFGDTTSRRKMQLSTGFLGVKDLNFALSDNGADDIAYKLLLREEFPSWLFPVKNGATTIWERWDGWTPNKGFQNPGMNSFNHYAYGAIGQWLYQVVAGIDIDPDEPGYKHTLIRPIPPRPGSEEAGKITHARAEIQSVYGKVSSGWKAENGRLVVEVEIAPNTRATVSLPCADAAGVRESGHPLDQAQGIRNVKVIGGRVTCEVGSGVYHFEHPWG